MPMSRIITVLFFTLVAATIAAADAIPLVPPIGTPSGGTTVNYPGTEGSLLPSGFSVSAGGNTLTFTQQGFPGSTMNFRRVAQTPASGPLLGCGTTWGGNFLPCTQLLYTGGADRSGLGPVTITFATPVVEIGLRAQNFAPVFPSPGAPQSFVASVFRGATPLVGGTFTFVGMSNNAADGSATFIGFRAINGDSFDRIVISSNTNDFAIGPVTFGPAGATGATPIPEPTTLLLLGTGTAALGIGRKLRKKNRTP